MIQAIKTTTSRKKDGYVPLQLQNDKVSVTFLVTEPEI